MNIHLEQLVYGSLPAWDRGYDVVGRSPGCSASTLSEVVGLCRRYGQPPSGSPGHSGLFAIRLESGPWAVVGAFPVGPDDQGRPGALVFHALIVPHQDYRRIGFDPFRLASALRSNWLPTSTVGAVDYPVPIVELAHSTTPTGQQPDAVEVAARMSSLRPGMARKVAIEAAAPIDGLARSAWARLPSRVRRRASVATWAYSTSISFDLVAFPRLVGLSLDASYHVYTAERADAPLPAPNRQHDARRWPRPSGLVIVGGILVALIGAFVLRGVAQPRSPVRPTLVEDAGASTVGPVSAEPSPVDQAKLARDLRSFADRFEAFDLGSTVDPAAFLARIDEHLHYDGPMLTDGEVKVLTEDPAFRRDPEAARVLEWHRKTLGLRRDARLPPLRPRGLSVEQQLGVLARSFRLVPGTRAQDVPSALSESLARPWAVRPSSLAGRFPALADYARFLGRLPRSDDGAR